MPKLESFASTSLGKDRSPSTFSTLSASPVAHRASLPSSSARSSPSITSEAHSSSRSIFANSREKLAHRSHSISPYCSPYDCNASYAGRPMHHGRTHGSHDPRVHRSQRRSSSLLSLEGVSSLLILSSTVCRSRGSGLVRSCLYSYCRIPSTCRRRQNSLCSSLCCTFLVQVNKYSTMSTASRD